VFIEVDMTRTHNTFGRGIPEGVACIPHMAKQEAAPRDEVVLVASVLWNMRIGKTTEWAEVADVWFVTVEHLEWGATSERGGWEHVLDVGRVENGPPPERTGEATQMV
jgi:hypothetical protein